MDGACTHIGGIESVKYPRALECDECVKIGSG
jgi:hypothetical protein